MKTRPHSSHYAPIPLKCPYCDKRSKETTFKTYHFVPFRFETDTHVSCVRCARRMLIGLFRQALSNGSLHPIDRIVRVFQAVQLLWVRKNNQGVHKALLEKIGLSSEPEKNKVAILGIYLAVSMIKADDQIHKEEINVAIDMGKHVLPGFDEHDFHEVVTHAMELPPVQIVATLLSNLLPHEGKLAVFNYLCEIAYSVKHSDEMSERLLLIEIATNLDMDVENIDIFF